VVKYVDPPMPTAEPPGYGPSPSPTPTSTPTPSAAEAKIEAEKKAAEITPGKKLYDATRDTSYIDPGSWSVTIFKRRHEFIVYYKGRMFKTYRAVFGRSFEPGTKLWEGDRRTPEGVYTIIGKHPSRRWQWFLTLNYPNIIDMRRYDQLRDGGVVPVEEGRPVGVGGRIGIHGTDNPLLNSGNVNWTTGCISVDNHDIDSLYKLLPVGTVVIIKP
jgi:murein L,D-transpeptidase YafK